MAVASLEMFKAGYFSGDPTEPYQVNAAGLNRLSAGQLAIGLQVSDSNPLAGLEGRAGLLSSLAEALHNPEYFGSSQRPGNMLGKHIISKSQLDANVDRLSSLSPLNSSLICPCYHHPHPLERPYRWPRKHLANLKNPDWRHIAR